MIAELPSYELIKAIKKVGFKSPEDYPWINIDIITNNQAFCKYSCLCVQNYEYNKFDNEIEVIMKPYMTSKKKKKIIYYIGQCSRCKKIYYTELENN